MLNSAGSLESSVYPAFCPLTYSQQADLTPPSWRKTSRPSQSEGTENHILYAPPGILSGKAGSFLAPVFGSISKGELM